MGLDCLQRNVTQAPTLNPHGLRSRRGQPPGVRLFVGRSVSSSGGHDVQPDSVKYRCFRLTEPRGRLRPTLLGVAWMSGQFPGSPRSGGGALGALGSGLLPRSPRQAEPGFVGRKAARSGGWGRCTSHFYGCLSLNFKSFVVHRFAPTDASTAPTIMRGTR